MGMPPPESVGLDLKQFVCLPLEQIQAIAYRPEEERGRITTVLTPFGEARLLGFNADELGYLRKMIEMDCERTFEHSKQLIFIKPNTHFRTVTETIFQPHPGSLPR